MEPWTIIGVTIPEKGDWCKSKMEWVQYEPLPKQMGQEHPLMRSVSYSYRRVEQASSRKKELFQRKTRSSLDVGPTYHMLEYNLIFPSKWDNIELELKIRNSRGLC